MLRTKLHAAVAACLATTLLMGAAAPAGADPGKEKKLRDAITVAGMKKHLQALQNIAVANPYHGHITRAAGTPGLELSRNYIVDQLRAAGYEPQIQPFDFPFFEEVTPAKLSRTSPDPETFTDADFATMTYSGSGDVTGNVQEVADNQFPPGAEASSSNAGCEPEDFAGFTAGNIALIQRGTCTFHDKALNAQNAGAVAVLIFNEGQPGRTDPIAGTLGSPDFTVPVLGISFARGEEIHNELGDGPVTMHVTTDTVSEIRQTWNVIAEAQGEKKNADHVIVQGSHLDSVLPGPGINDNGSGSAYNLESAIQLAKEKIKPKNTIRFAWWSGEELGLLGSTFYVGSLSDPDFAKIALNLNFDMLASPNFVRFVYDGDGNGKPGNPVGPTGSGTIEAVFNNWLTKQGLAFEPTPFDGRSDYGPFIARGAPAGGLFSGAEVVKTQAQTNVFGGVTGEAFDRCYHQACDTMSNLNVESYDQLSDAAATTLMRFANSDKSVADTETKAKRRSAKHKRRAVRRSPSSLALADQEYLGPLAQR